ncbi:unnamed protein product [Sphagnum jensenii]|uniref:Uncharacterized protein n=1 Tax=Sphagnum jensenii TaxID=128206 RepID=A0ABP1A5E8_9BRYO
MSRCCCGVLRSHACRDRRCRTHARIFVIRFAWYGSAVGRSFLSKVSDDVAGPGLMPESMALPTLVRESGIEYLLPYRVGESCSFRHRRYCDVACKLGDVLHFYRNHRTGWSLNVRVRRFYVQNFSELARHDGEGSFVSELFVQIRELNLDSMREERFRSLRVYVEIWVISGER